MLFIIGRRRTTDMPPVRGDDDGTTGYAVYGFSRRGGYSLVGDSDSNYGVLSTSISNVGVYGVSFGRDGVVGQSYSFTGAGVAGYSDSPFGRGVYGSSDSGHGVYGSSLSGNGVYGRSDSGRGVLGNSPFGRGVYGSSFTGDGVYGSSSNGDGVYGSSYSGYGVYGESRSGTGVYGRSNGFGVFGQSDSGFGVFGVSESGFGMYCYSSTGFAAWLDGGVIIRGPLSKPGGSFKIDHPLDPANKYLSHSFVESPDMKNVYDGVAVLDDKGEADIELPDWFGALNKDFRYQLTAIGAPGPNLYIAEEISDGITNYSGNSSSSDNNLNSHFKIAGGASGMKVSWQVTGIRKDPWANAHRIQVEEDKPDKERGYYMYPDLYGQSAENGMISRLLFPPEEKQGLLINENKLT
jgi:hypothetical protein